jgi:hypothetical protein
MQGLSPKCADPANRYEKSMSSGPFAGIRKFGPLGPGGGVLGPETSGMPVTRPEPWISLSQCSR